MVGGAEEGACVLNLAMAELGKDIESEMPLRSRRLEVGLEGADIPGGKGAMIPALASR